MTKLTVAAITMVAEVAYNQGPIHSRKLFITAEADDNLTGANFPARLRLQMTTLLT